MQNTNTNTTSETRIIPVNSPTLGGVLAEKVIGHIKNNNIKTLSLQAAELFFGAFLGSLLVAPNQIMAGVENLLKTQDFALPKFVGFAILFWGRKFIFRTIKGLIRAFQRIGRRIETQKAIQNDEPLLDGIPVPELVDYLLRNKKFKREGVNGVRQTFGLNMERFNRLAKNLEEVKVLIRGENNGRELDGAWSRQALIDHLSGERKSSELKPRFVIKRIGDNHKQRLMRNELATA